MRLVLLTLVIACFAYGEAKAQSCSDSDSSSSSSSDSSYDDDSSWSSSSDSSSSDSRPNPCANDSGIVGDSRCHRFGRWDVSRRRAWSLSLDVGTLRLAMDDIAISGSSMHDNRPHAWRADNLRSGAGARAALRMRVFIHPNFFVGAEGAIGGVFLDGQTESVDSTVELNNAHMVGGGLLVGAGVGLGRLRLDLELAGGRRRIVFKGTSYTATCTESFSESFSQWTLRGGAGISFFMLPNVSIGVHARYGFLQQEINGTLSLSIHSRAYDAR